MPQNFSRGLAQPLIQIAEDFATADGAAGRDVDDGQALALKESLGQVSGAGRGYLTKGAAIGLGRNLTTSIQLCTPDAPRSTTLRIKSGNDVVSMHMCTREFSNRMLQPESPEGRAR